MNKIDVNSPEFMAEKEKTVKFVEKVQKSTGWVYNPDNEVNESVIVGLTRNQIIYGKKYCPCFVVQESGNNRVCPCTIGVKEEIPTDGTCHCGIYCTPEFAQSQKIEIEAEVVAHTHSRGLSKAECEALLKEVSIDGDDIDSLLEARELGLVDFKLVDVREWNEWKHKRIEGTDFLVPTTSFYQSVEQLEEFKNFPLIVYCFSGSRSNYIQRVMKDMGYKHVVNFRRGIMSYSGKTIRG
ncbi:MAG: hypothetical protein JXR64_12370 [Spirochaetales bacterium]|nr:hypothetical protein [Spirochaetales bacterium]